MFQSAFTAPSDPAVRGSRVLMTATLMTPHGAVSVRIRDISVAGADLGGIARSDRLRCDPETRVLLRRREGGAQWRKDCRSSILPSLVRPGVRVGIPAESSSGDGGLRLEAAKCGQSLSWTTIFPCEPLAAGRISILNGLPSFDLPVTASPETAASTPCFLNWSI